MDYLAKKSAVLDYLKKYGGNFDVTGYMEQTWGMTYEQWYVKNKETLESFTVYGRYTDNGYTLKDSRQSPGHLKKIKAIAETYAKKYFKRFQITAETNRLTVSVHKIEVEPGAEVNSFIRLLSNKFNEMDYKDIWIKIKFNEDNDQNTLHIESSPSYSFYLNKEGKLIQQDILANNISISSQTIDDETLTPEQIERLCTIVYLDDILMAKPDDTLGEIISYLLACGPDEPLPCEMNKQEWENVFTGILKDAKLTRLHITHFEDVRYEKPDVLPGFRSVCFMDNQRNAYVIYRGTCGDKEWADNGLGMIEEDTVQQKYALKYALQIRENLNINSLTVAGHSKGGNKAKYVALVAPENYVDRCISVDGQGFSPAFVEKYKNNIDSRKNIITIAEHRDFINCMGISVGETKYYRGRRGKKTPTFPYGEPLPFFHCPDALRKSNGEFGEEFENSVISSPINRFIVKFLTDDAYKSNRTDTVNNIITLVMHKKTATDAEIAEALANLLTVFIDMAAKCKDFDDELANIVFNEQDVIISTLEIAFNQTENQTSDTSLVDLFIGKFVNTILLRPVYIINLITVIVKFIAFVTDISKDKTKDCRLLVYILNLLCSVMENLAENNHFSYINKKLVQYLTNLKNKLEDNQTQNAELTGSDKTEQPEIDVYALLDSWKNNLTEQNVHNGVDLSL